jgi:hypothetical protein
MQAVTMTDTHLLGMIILVGLFDVAVLVFSHLSNPLTGTPLSIDIDTVSLICSSTSATVTFIIFLKQGVMTIWGVYLAYSTREVHKNFNETTAIGVCIYNSAVFTATIVPIVIYIEPSDPVVAAFLRGLLTSYIAIFTLVCLYAPRFYLIWKKQDFAAQDEASSTMKKPSFKRQVSTPTGTAEDQVCECCWCLRERSFYRNCCFIGFSPFNFHFSFFLGQVKLLQAENQDLRKQLETSRARLTVLENENAALQDQARAAANVEMIHIESTDMVPGVVASFTYVLCLTDRG